jgi:hypothetical protein
MEKSKRRVANEAAVKVVCCCLCCVIICVKYRGGNFMPHFRDWQKLYATQDVKYYIFLKQ